MPSDRRLSIEARKPLRTGLPRRNWAALVGTLLASTAAAAPPWPHPYRDPKLSPSQAPVLEQAVSQIMKLSEEQLLALVPGQPGIRYCGCPNCNGGQQESGVFAWTINAPFQVTCRYCGHVFPSTQYPENTTETALSPRGSAVAIHYHRGTDGTDHHFTGVTRHFRQRWLVEQALALAKAYHTTHKPAYARRAALIMDRFAQVYPDYCPLRQWPYKPRRFVQPEDRPNARWGHIGYYEIPRILPLAYDLIHSSPELDRLSGQVGVDVRQRIERDLFRAAVEYSEDLWHQDKVRLCNEGGRLAIGLARIGRSIGEPEYVHRAHRWLAEFSTTQYFFDGIWKDGPGYHRQATALLSQVANELAGYSDPPGYRDPSGATPLRNLVPDRQVPVIGRLRRATDALRFPDGRLCPLGDTSPQTKPATRLGESRHQLLPGYGHAVLAAGHDANRMTVHLQFRSSYGFHNHLDNLGLVLFAFGREMLPDLGYSHSRLRQWTASTAAHNTVVVDRANQERWDCNGNLLRYVPTLPGLAAVEASGRRSYPDRTTVYRRLLLLVTVDRDHPYVLDVFQVEGGSVHDWMMHGSADHEQRSVCSLDLDRPVQSLLAPGEQWTEPRHERSPVNPYGLMKNIRSTTSADTCSVLFLYQDQSGLGTRIDLLGGEPTEFLLCDTPSVRRAGRDDRLIHQYRMPQLIARRRGPAPLESQYVALIEPFLGAPHTEGVERLPVQAHSKRAIGVRVKAGQRVDTILLSLDDSTENTVAANGTTLQGRIGLVSTVRDRVVAAYLIGGQFLRHGSFQLDQPLATYEGTIESATRRVNGDPTDGLVTRANLPLGAGLAGSWVIVTHGDGTTHGYEIDQIERNGGLTRINLRHDHGLRINGQQTEETFFPARRFQGPSRFRIELATAYTPAESP